MRSLSVTAMGIALAELSLVAQGPPPTFRSSVDVIAVDVQVVDRHGAPVASLGPAQFSVTIDGRPRNVVTADLVSVDVEGVAGAPAGAAPAAPSPRTLPVELTVALDVSQSVSGSVLDPLRRAVQELARDLTAKDRLRLLTFNVRITRLIDFGTPAGGIPVFRSTSSWRRKRGVSWSSRARTSRSVPPFGRS